MTEQHPLTDAKCREIANNLCFRWPPHVDQGEVLYSEDDMRVAYDVGRDEQLKQVIKALNQCKEEKGLALKSFIFFIKSWKQCAQPRRRTHE